MTPREERSTVGRRWGKNAKRPCGGNGGLGIDRCKSVADKHGRRSDASCHRGSVWNLRNPNGCGSDAEEAEAEAKDRVSRKTASLATLNITPQTIGGISGKRSREEVARSMRNNGAIDIPNPTYGYLGGSQITHGRMDQCLYNDWIQRDLDEMIYVDRLGGTTAGRHFCAI